MAFRRYTTPKRCGTVYQLTPYKATYQLSVLYDFPGTAAAFPYAGVTYADGALYGTTAEGGISDRCIPSGIGCGTVFEVTP